ncbi:hypothetical protein R3P38DRAFT_3403511 [Favolaschia claudopus]|uniref:DUF6534 domain-containing protein n=1 Tax=Favolaschia claudopus TaxID=2862362 RepID=A0AAW0AE51_9AGAR
MPAVDVQVLPALTREDPLFGLIYYVLGGWFIGGSSVLLLEGILIAQVSNYFTWYQKDSLRLKLMVAVLFILTILKSIQSFAITWINSVLYMRDPAGTIALNKAWYQIVNIPLGAGIALYVQSYYTYRLYKLSGRWFYVVPLIAVMILGFVAAVITASVIAKSGKSSDWFAIHLSSAFATDVLITLASVFFLLQAREKALSQTKGLISGLIKGCCQTALPVTIATLMELICSRIGGKSLKPQASNSIILVLLECVPIIYANCMLYILNTRRSLRSTDGSSNGANHHTNTISSGNANRSRGRWKSATAVELGSLGGVQVHTEVDHGASSPADFIDFDSKHPRVM